MSFCGVSAGTAWMFVVLSIAVESDMVSPVCGLIGLSFLRILITQIIESKVAQMLHMMIRL